MSHIQANAKGDGFGSVRKHSEAFGSVNHFRKVTKMGRKKAPLQRWTVFVFRA